MSSNYIIHLDKTYQLQIDHHPLLDLPPKERNAARELRNDFAELLLKYMGVNLSFDETESHESLLPLLENQVVNRKLGGKCIFDNEAFMETLSYTLRTCDAKTTKSFCGFFMDTYKQRIKNATIELIAQKKGGSPYYRKETRKILKPLEDILREQERTLEDLTDQELDNLCDTIGEKSGKVKEAIRIRQRFNSISLDSGPDEDEDIDPIQGRLLLANAQSFEDPFKIMGYVDDIINILNMIDADKKEYPQLFINHGLVRALKDAEKDYEALLYAYTQREKILYDKVFLYDYLLFILKQPPQPDTVEHLDEAEFKAGRAKLNEAICEYKNKDKSTVSRRYKKFIATYLEITKHQLYS